MQVTNKLTPLLRSLVALLEDEAANNPQFAAKLDAVLNGMPGRPKKARGPQLDPSTVPDVFAALDAKGETEFGFWLRTLDLPTLKAIIKLNGFDPGKASLRWKDADKLVGLAFTQALGRSTRGSAFLRPKGCSGSDKGIDLEIQHVVPDAKGGANEVTQYVQAKTSPKKESQE
jgi:hypothetical protein